jgi:tripartite-type tricarboxylate transporter receptor subunit TctC
MERPTCSQYTPADIVARLNAVVNAGLAEPRIKTRLAGLGATTLPGSEAAFERLIAAETDKWSKVIRTAGIKPE